MNTIPLRFIHAGFGHVVCANRVSMVLNPQTASARRQIRAAKEVKPCLFVDMTFGRATKSVLVLDGGTVIGCGLTYRTMMARLNGDTPSESETEVEACMSAEAEEAPKTEEAE